MSGLVCNRNSAHFERWGPCDTRRGRRKQTTNAPREHSIELQIGRTVTICYHLRPLPPHTQTLSVVSSSASDGAVIASSQQARKNSLVNSLTRFGNTGYYQYISRSSFVLAHWFAWFIPFAPHKTLIPSLPPTSLCFGSQIETLEEAKEIESTQNHSEL